MHWEGPGGRSEDAASIRSWMAEWESHIGARDFAAARRLFHDGILGFGSVTDVATGLDQLEAEQWRLIWPNMKDFAFEQDHMKIVLSWDRLLASVAVTWSSTGCFPGREPFPRLGRATLVLRRDEVARPWRAVHTHFSLNPSANRPA